MNPLIEVSLYHILLADFLIIPEKQANPLIEVSLLSYFVSRFVHCLIIPEKQANPLIEVSSLFIRVIIHVMSGV